MKKILILISLCILFTASINLYSFAKKRNNLLPEFGKWKFEGQIFSDPNINNPDFISLGNNSFRAYFMYQGSILSAFSNNGKDFTLEEGVRIQSGQHPAVIKLSDGRIRIYYSTSDNKNLISAISSDGLNFVNENGIRLNIGSSGERDDRGIIHPSIIAIPEGGYRIYYDAEGTNGEPPFNWNGILSATSTDGLTFIKDKGVRMDKKRFSSASLVWSPFIEIEDGIYKLYFSLESNVFKKNGAYVATSEDGLTFVTYNKPVLKRNRKLGPAKSTVGGLPGLPQDVFIINVTGGQRMFYWSAGGYGTYSAFLQVN